MLRMVCRVYRCWVMTLLVTSFHGFMAHAAEGLEYRFERLWPRLEQPWYFNDPNALAIAVDGSVYIVDTENHRIQHFNAEGIFIRQWGEQGSEAGQFKHPSGICITVEGQILVADTGNHRIQRFRPDGVFVTSYGSLGNQAGQFNFPKAIAAAPDGGFYVADTSNHRIQRFGGNGAFILQWGRQGSNPGEFVRPSGIGVATDGTVTVADTSRHRLQQFNGEGQFIRAWGGDGSGVDWQNQPDGSGDQNGQFNSPTGIAIAPNGDILVADTWNSRVQRFTADGRFVRVWGQWGGGDTGDFFGVLGVAAAPDGRVYVTDTGNRVQIFSADGKFLSAWRSRGSHTGQFNRPKDIASAPDGSVYVADADNNRIQQFDAQGRFLQQWGGYGLREGQFRDPSGIAFDETGRVYVADRSNHRIQIFDANGRFIGQWGLKGGAPGQFSYPSGVAIAVNGNVYVADTGNHRIQQFDAQGQFIRQWGSAGDGPGQFNEPHNLAVTREGFVVIADTGNHRVQAFQANGEWIAQWGDGEGNEPGRFSYPFDVEVSPIGHLLVADTHNHRIQSIDPRRNTIENLGSPGTGDSQFNEPYGLAVTANAEVYVVDTVNNRIQKFVPRGKTLIESNQLNQHAITHPYKAILLAGGGEAIGGRKNHIWDGTWRITQRAYRALTRQAFVIHDEIKFLTAGSTQFDLDTNGHFDDLEPASKASLRQAITDWAKDAKDVVIYLANHGGPGTFRINDTEALTSAELHDWLSDLQRAIPGHVTVIIESCNSGSFLPPLASAPRPRFLFASAHAEQAAVISNDGINSFSYYFWSEIGLGAKLQNAFRTARQAMSQTVIESQPRDAQTDADGDGQFTENDLAALGDYCLGNCNTTASDPPSILPLAPNAHTLHGARGATFSITVSHLAPFNSAWILMQRPDDLVIDPNQPLNFEKIPLQCQPGTGQTVCQGRYDRFDVAGEYRLHFHAMDMNFEVSLPEMLTVTQTQGAAIAPVYYDDRQAIVYLRDVTAGGQRYQATLELNDGLFTLGAARFAPHRYEPAATFDAASGVLTIPLAQAFGQPYHATFQHLGNFVFQLQSAAPR